MRIQSPGSLPSFVTAVKDHPGSRDPCRISKDLNCNHSGAQPLHFLTGVYPKCQSYLLHFFTGNISQMHSSIYILQTILHHRVFSGHPTWRQSPSETNYQIMRQPLLQVLSICCIHSLNSHKETVREMLSFSSVQFSSVAQSCPALCNPMDCTTPAFPAHHQLLELTQTHVHQVSDAIQPSCPLSYPSPPALNLSQHQGLFKWVSSLHQMAKVLEFQLQHQSFQWTFRTDFL